MNIFNSGYTAGFLYNTTSTLATLTTKNAQPEWPSTTVFPNMLKGHVFEHIQKEREAIPENEGFIMDKKTTKSNKKYTKVNNKLPTKKRSSQRNSKWTNNGFSNEPRTFRSDGSIIEKTVRSI